MFVGHSPPPPPRSRPSALQVTVGHSAPVNWIQRLNQRRRKTSPVSRRVEQLGIPVWSTPSDRPRVRPPSCEEPAFVLYTLAVLGGVKMSQRGWMVASALVCAGMPTLAIGNGRVDTRDEQPTRLTPRSSLLGRSVHPPLSFEANLGQADQEVRFLARAQGYRAFLL